MFIFRNRIWFAAFALVIIPSLGQAHPGHGAGGFLHGIEHPFGGLDHILAMVAVGLWAAQLGGRAFYLVPLSFVSVMILGGLMGVAGIQVPFVEEGILTSILILGLLIAAAVRVPLWASVMIVACFAVFHGFAHGAEMPSSSSGLGYGAGFVLATATLHAIGMGLGVAMGRTPWPKLTRLAGTVIIMAGLFLVAT